MLQIEDVSSFLNKCLVKTSILGHKLMQIESLVPELKEDEDFIRIVSMLNDVNVCMKSLIDLSKSSSNKITKCVEKFHCERYGGLCEIECEYRYEKMTLWNKIIRWSKLKCRKKKVTDICKG